MILFFAIELLLLIGVFVLWFFDPMYFHVGYVLFHTYPVYYFIVAFFFRKKTLHVGFTPKIVALLMPILLWMLGLLYIYGRTNFI